MTKVNNKKTIGKLANSAFRNNKTRNLFAIVAILLTTVLFTGLFTVAASLNESMQESTMRQVGGSTHGTFKYIDQETYDKIKTHPSIKEIGYSVVMSIADNKPLATRPTEIRYMSGEKQAERFYTLPTTGRLPQADHEIATDTIVLNQLGVPAELGQTVTLEFTISGQQYTQDFTLVGFWEGDPLMHASQALLNRGYIETMLKDYVPVHNEDIIGTMNADVMFSNSINIEGKLEKVLADLGYAPGEIAIGINWAYTGNSGEMDFGTVISVGGALLMIVLCGYLIISNVFAISITKDIREYGLLKTIGTTGRQIKRMIGKQAVLLCLIGIPLGLIAGYLVGVAMVPTVLSVVSTNYIKFSASPLIFIGSALFAIVTVAVSVARPARMAAKVSPIEALRMSDVTGGKKSMRNSGKISLLRMARYNVFRNGKKAILVMLSLSLSLMILNGAYSLANSFDMEKYLAGEILTDYALADVSYFNVHLSYTNQGTLSPEFLAELTQQKGIEQLNKIYFSDFAYDADPRLSGLPDRLEKELGIEGRWLEFTKNELANPQWNGHMYGLEDDTFSTLNVFSGTIDLEKLKTGGYVIAMAYDTEGKVSVYNVGDKVTIAGRNGVTKEYEVMAVANVPWPISIRHSHPISPEFILPAQLFLENMEQKAPMLVTLDVADELIPQMDAFVTNWKEADLNFHYNSRASLAEEYRGTQQTYRMVGTVLSLLVGFVGIMNFINTMLTSVISRRREFAMLQSVGMTTKQTERTLLLEGVLYSVFTLLFTLTIGYFISQMMITSITGGSRFMNNYFTIMPSLLCFPALLAISAIVPLLCQRTVGKQSIVERLREAE